MEDCKLKHFSFEEIMTQKSTLENFFSIISFEPNSNFIDIDAISVTKQKTIEGNPYLGTAYRIRYLFEDGSNRIVSEKTEKLSEKTILLAIKALFSETFLTKTYFPEPCFRNELIHIKSLRLLDNKDSYFLLKK